MRFKKMLSVVLSVIAVAAMCCSSFVSSASLFFIDGNASICPGTTKNYVEEENYNYAWIDDAVVRDSTTSVAPLVLHPVTDYPYSHTSEEFISECNNYADLFDVSGAILENSMVKTLETSYYALLASGAIKSNEQEMRAYNESMGINYSHSSGSMTRIYTTIVYALLKSDIASSVLKQEVEIPRGTSLEGAVVIYLSKVCGMNVPVTVDSIESFAYTFADEYVLEESDLPVGDEPSKEEVYYWIRVSAADKQGYDVPKDTPYLEVTQEQMDYVTYAYYASILTSKYNVYVSPEKLKQAVISSECDTDVPRLVLMSMLDSVNAEYSSGESLESLFDKAKTEGFFELEDDFYSDIYNYEIEVSDNSSEVWITAFLVADQLTDASSDNAKTYINGQLVNNLSTNSIKLTGDSTVFTVKIEYSDENRDDVAEYKFTVKKTSGSSNNIGGVSVDLNQPIGEILDSVVDSVSEYLPETTTSSSDTTTSPYSEFQTSATTYAIDGYDITDFSALNSNFLETYPTDANGNVEVTKDPLETTAKEETTTQQIQNVLSGVTQTIKDKPEYVATPIGLLAFGASAGYIFFRKKKDDVVAEDENITEIEDIEID